MALAKSATATPSQGELLEQLLEKQKKGEGGYNLTNQEHHQYSCDNT